MDRDRDQAPPSGPAPSRGAVRAGRLARIARAAALALAAGAVPGAAAAEALAPCTSPAADAEEIFARIEAEGYARVAPGDHLADALAERLAWIPALAYLGADSGGEPLAAVLGLQRRAVANLGRLRPTPASASAVFAATDAVVLARWQEVPAGGILVSCAAAVFADDEGAPPPAGGRYGGYTRRDVIPGADGASVTQSRFAFDRDAILAEVPGAAPPHHVITVLMRFKGESQP